VVVIAGTGSTKAGRNRAGETFRTLGLGGDGGDWGDWGGGSGITEAAVAAVARAYIGLDPPTILSERLVAHAGMDDVAGLLKGLTREHLELECAAPLVFAAAAVGDAVARAILVRAGRALAAGANLVIRKLGMEGEDFELVLAGGVFRAQEPSLVATLVGEVQAVAPRARPVRLDAPPAAGGVLLAMEAVGLQPDEGVRARLLETARALER
jgi:N-acetylglucosamine kinase-like BadF-type ATPase